MGLLFSKPTQEPVQKTFSPEPYKPSEASRQKQLELQKTGKLPTVNERLRQMMDTERKKGFLTKLKDTVSESAFNLGADIFYGQDQDKNVQMTAKYNVYDPEVGRIRYFDNGGKELGNKNWDQMSPIEKSDAVGKNFLASTVGAAAMGLAEAGTSTVSGLGGAAGIIAQFTPFKKDDEVFGSLSDWANTSQSVLSERGAATYTDPNVFKNPSLLLNPEFYIRESYKQAMNIPMMMATGGWSEGVLEGGQEFSERRAQRLLNGEKVTTTGDAVFASTIGVINGMLGRYGFKAVFGGGTPAGNMATEALSQKLRSGLIKRTVDVITKSGIASIEEASTEFLQETIPILAAKIVYDEGGTMMEVIKKAGEAGGQAFSSALVTSLPISVATQISQDRATSALAEEKALEKQAVKDITDKNLQRETEAETKKAEQIRKAPQKVSFEQITKEQAGDTEFSDSVEILSQKNKGEIYKAEIKAGKVEYDHGFTDDNMAGQVKSDLAMEEIKAGKRDPIVVDLQDGKLVATDGNHHLWAYKQLGIENVPVIMSKEAIAANTDSVTGSDVSQLQSKALKIGEQIVNESINPDQKMNQVAEEYAAKSPENAQKAILGRVKDITQKLRSSASDKVASLFLKQFGIKGDPDTMSPTEISLKGNTATYSQFRDGAIAFLKGLDRGSVFGMEIANAKMVGGTTTLNKTIKTTPTEERIKSRTEVPEKKVDEVQKAKEAEASLLEKAKSAGQEILKGAASLAGDEESISPPEAPTDFDNIAQTREAVKAVVKDRLQPKTVVAGGEVMATSPAIKMKVEKEFAKIDVTPSNIDNLKQSLANLDNKIKESEGRKLELYSARKDALTEKIREFNKRNLVIHSQQIGGRNTPAFKLATKGIKGGKFATSMTAVHKGFRVKIPTVTAKGRQSAVRKAIPLMVKAISSAVANGQLSAPAAQILKRKIAETNKSLGKKTVPAAILNRAAKMGKEQGLAEIRKQKEKRNLARKAIAQAYKKAYGRTLPRNIADALRRTTKATSIIRDATKKAVNFGREEATKIGKKGTEKAVAEEKERGAIRLEEAKKGRERNVAKVKEANRLLRETFTVKDILGKVARRRAVEMVRTNLPLQLRGKFLNAIRNARISPRTLSPGKLEFLEKLYYKVRSERKAYEKRQLIAGIKKIAKSLDRLPLAVQKKILSALETISVQKPSEKTKQRLRNTQEYLERVGSTISMPQRVLNQLKLLEQTPLSDMSLTKLIRLNNQLVMYYKVGRALMSNQLFLLAEDKQQALMVLEQNSKNLDIIPANNLTPEAKKTISLWKKVKSGARAIDLALLGIDRLFDMLDGGKDYIGANFQIFKTPVDKQWNKFEKIRDDIKHAFWSIVRELKIDDASKERIAIVAYREQKGGMKKLLEYENLTEESINAIELDEREQFLLDWMRAQINVLKPLVAKTFEKTQNKELGTVENYFPMMTDFSNWNKLGEDFENDHLRRGMAFGHVKERLPKAKQLLILNAVDVFDSYTEKAAYYVTMEETINRLGRIASSERYLKSVGKTGQEIVLHWIDVLSRKGGVAGQPKDGGTKIVNALNSSISFVILGYRLTTIMKQPLALLDGAAEIGHWAFDGAKKMVEKDWREFVLESSSEMRNRVGGDPAFVERASNKKIAKIQEGSMKPMQVLDQYAAGGVWIGAYQQKMKELGAEIDFGVNRKKPTKEGMEEVNSIQWFRGQDSRNKNSIDSFYSASEDVAGDFGEASPMTERPINTLIVPSKDFLAENLGFKGDPTTMMDFDLVAKKYAQENGYDSIMYREGTLGEPELHVFGKAEFSGKEISQEAREMGSDQGFSDYTLDQIAKEDYTTEVVSVEQLRKQDPDLDAYLKSGEIREFEGEAFGMNPVVSSSGEVLDGYNRIVQIVKNGGMEVEILRGVKKNKNAPATTPKTQEETAHDKAVLYADRIVRKTQATANFKDLPPAMTAKYRTWSKLVFKFQQFMLNRWAYMRYDFPEKLSKDKQKATMQATFLTMSILAEAGISSLYYILRSQEDETEKEKKELLKKGIISSFISSVPVLGSIYGTIRFGGASPVPLVEFLNKFIGSVGSMLTGKKPETRAKHTLRVVSYIAGLWGIPTDQARDILEQIFFQKSGIIKKVLNNKKPVKTFKPKLFKEDQ